MLTPPRDDLGRFLPQVGVSRRETARVLRAAARGAIANGDPEQAKAWRLQARRIENRGSRRR